MKQSLLISGGTVVDGTGRPGFRGDVLVAGDRIEAVGKVRAPADAGRIDASGCVVAPGFIDIHSHSDLMLLGAPFPLAKTQQGVTTELIGSCGFSLAPVTEPTIRELKDLGVLGEVDVAWEWRSYAKYADRMERASLAHNVCGLVGHNTIRANVLGMGNAKVTPDALSQMKDLVREAMEAGACGLSTGLIYTPGLYATADEMAELCKVVAEYGGIHATHMRNENVRLVESVRESIAVSERSGVALQIVHLKVTGEENYPLIERAMEEIHAARARGLDVTFDQYPYTAGSTGLSALLPIWVREGGTEAMLRRIGPSADRKGIAQEMEDGNRAVIAPRWGKVLVTSVVSEANKAVEGKSIEEIARARGCAPAEAVFDLLLAEHGRVGMVVFSMSEESIRFVLKEDFGMVGTDGIHGGKCHPRLYGTFPRVLGKYVREEKVLPLELAVRKMTANPADRLRLSDRGRIAAGKRADLVVFDPATVIDRATYEDPTRYPDGIRFVIVGGRVVLEASKPTGAMPGRFLRYSAKA